MAEEYFQCPKCKLKSYHPEDIQRRYCGGCHKFFNDNVRIIKETDDPICDRISAGGSSGIGYYVVYRGDLERVKECFRICLKALEEHHE